MFGRQTHSLRRQSRSIRPVACSPQLTRRCLFEPLEDRRLLACVVELIGRTLFVRGDEGDNQISVGQRNDQVIVTCDGSFTRKPSGDIDAVQVKGGDGDDSLNVARVDPTLSVLGEAGNDIIHVIIDVNDDDGLVKPSDSIAGGGGQDTININATALADIIKIIGTGNRVIPDPEITVSNAAGAELAHLFVQEAEAITVNTRGGDDQVELEDPQGFFAGLDLAINTGEGADSVRYLVGLDPSNPSQPNAPQHLLVNLGSTPDPDGRPQPGAAATAVDSFFLDATAGWINPPVGDHPATIEVLGDRGTQQVTLKFGQIGEPVPGNQMPTGLMIHMALGAGDDSADVSYGTGIYVPVQLNAEMGTGNDMFAATFLPGGDIARGANTWTGRVLGGAGNDTFHLNVGPHDPPSDTPLPHIATALDVNFDGGAGDDSFFDVFRNVQLDAPVTMNLMGGDGNDFFDPTVQLTILQPYLVTEDGGAGDDTFIDTWSDVEWRGPVTLDYRGGNGNDKFSEVMQKVQVGMGFMMNLDGGLGDDRAALEVREAACPGDPSLPPGPCQPIDIDVATGAGMDTVEATLQDIGVDLHLDASLGAGDDSFTGTVRPDSTRSPGDIMPCYEIAVGGGSGADTFRMNVGDVDPPEPELPQPLAAELMLNFAGDAGSDSFLIGLLNVAIDGPVTIVEVGGAGNDSFHDTFSQVAANGGIWNIAHHGGAGNDSLHSSFSDVFADLSIGANLGSGNDTAVIAIIRKAATASLSSSAVPSELVPTVHVEVAAGAGNDDVTLAIDRAIEDFSAFLDGGKGRDFDHVTENVKARGRIVNFEKEELLPYIEQAPSP